MNVERVDGTNEKFDDLTPKEVAEKVEGILMSDGSVKQITITPNRHERRREAALARKKKKTNG